MRDTTEHVRRGGIAAIFNFIGGVTGAIALATVIFSFGTLVEQLKSVNSRVQEIERNGTPLMREHIKLDDQRAVSEEARLKMLESNNDILHRVDTKVESLSVKLDAIKERMDRSEKIAGKGY